MRDLVHVVRGAAHVEVAQPLGPVASADGHQKEGLLGTVLARHALGGNGVRHHVVRAGDEVHHLVEDLASVLVGRGGDLLEAQRGESGLHVRRRVRPRLVVRGLGVGHGREHGARGREVVVVLRGVAEEPVVVPENLGRDGLRARGHACEVYARDEAARAAGGVPQGLELARLLDHALAQTALLQAVPHGHGKRHARYQHHRQQGEKNAASPVRTPPLGRLRHAASLSNVASAASSRICSSVSRAARPTPSTRAESSGVMVMLSKRCAM